MERSNFTFKHEAICLVPGRLRVDRERGMGWDGELEGANGGQTDG